jgi:hypothetical protein
VIVRGDIFWQTITREEESLPVGLARRQVDIPDAPMRYATQCCSHQWQFNLPGDGPQTVDNLRASATATATLCLSCYPKLSFSKEMTKSKAWLVLDIMVVSVNFRNCGDSEVGRKSANVFNHRTHVPTERTKISCPHNTKMRLLSHVQKLLLQDFLEK